MVSTHFKNISQISPGRGEHKTCLKPPPRDPFHIQKMTMTWVGSIPKKARCLKFEVGWFRLCWRYCFLWNWICVWFWPWFLAWQCFWQSCFGSGWTKKRPLLQQTWRNCLRVLSNTYHMLHVWNIHLYRFLKNLTAFKNPCIHVPYMKPELDTSFTGSPLSLSISPCMIW